MEKFQETILPGIVVQLRWDSAVYWLFLNIFHKIDGQLFYYYTIIHYGIIVPW